MSRNIEMNYYNGSNYEVLYPSVMMNNIGDWNSKVYSKSEIDSKVSEVNTTVTNLEDKMTNIHTGQVIPWVKFKEATYQDTVELSNTNGESTYSKNEEFLPENYLGSYEDIALGIQGSINIPNSYFWGDVKYNKLDISLRLSGGGREFKFITYTNSSKDGNDSRSYNYDKANLIYTLYFYETTMNQHAVISTNNFLGPDSLVWREWLPLNQEIYFYVSANCGNGSSWMDFNYNLTITMYKRPSILTYNPYILG